MGVTTTGKKTVVKVAISLHQVLADLVTLETPATSAAVAAFILAIIPGVNISVAVLTGAVAAVGVVAAVVEKLT